MTCCGAPTEDTSRFFSFLSVVYRIRYALLGFEETQKHLIEGIRRSGFGGARLLEIGCGTGDLHRALLERGAADAAGVDLSPRMLAIARRRAQESQMDTRTRYREGDFVALAESLEPADVTILHKVVCCYPDVDTLLDRSLEKTRRVYALTYPRDRRRVRFSFALSARMLRLLGSEFRPYVHDPQRIHAHIVEHGFQPAYTRTTSTWQTDVYSREVPRQA